MGLRMPQQLILPSLSRSPVVWNCCHCWAWRWIWTTTKWQVFCHFSCSFKVGAWVQCWSSLAEEFIFTARVHRHCVTECLCKLNCLVFPYDMEAESVWGGLFVCGVVLVLDVDLHFLFVCLLGNLFSIPKNPTVFWGLHLELYVLYPPWFGRSFWSCYIWDGFGVTHADTCVILCCHTISSSSGMTFVLYMHDLQLPVTHDCLKHCRITTLHSPYVQAQLALNCPVSIHSTTSTVLSSKHVQLMLWNH